jgi:hypothetical protein
MWRNISEALNGHQTKFCVFLEKNWVFPQTVVSGQAMTTLQNMKLTSKKRTDK